jgi:cytosine/adenosine deaminase-related metal-dependent hydrolase
MSAAKISLVSPCRYALEGRVVTLGPQGILPDGVIFIEDSLIRAVQPAAAPPPPGFEAATRIRTGDTLFPGLIELHNHLAYNAIPIWLLPRKFTNNGQWRSLSEYRRNVTGPAQVLGNTAGLVEAVIRFVECRAMLSGTTTSQGITLIGVGTRAYFAGLVRNVEAPLMPGLSAAETRIDNPPTNEADKQKYLENQRAATCYLQHLSEGIDATARSWFTRLLKADGTWAIHRSLCGIHSTALTRQDFDVLVQHGASMVWSPLSNYLLYGGTADIRAAAASGIKMGLGSDWGPSGSKGLLGELKVAWLASQQAGGVFSAEQLVRMATTNAAEILGWQARLGSLEPGKLADIIAIDGKTGDPFQQLIKARDASLTLVVIDGVPRVGQLQFMNRFQLAAPESLRLGGARRLLHLAQQNAHPLVQALTLAEATRRLEEALQNLPALAGQVGEALLSGLEAGSEGSPLSPLRLDLDLSDEPLQTLAASLASDVFPMQLEAITVADDPTFLPKMEAALNLPEFIKEGLPGLYGRPRPAPFGAGERQVAVPGLPARLNASVQTLRQFLGGWRKFTLEQRKTVVDQALLILEQNYVHLPYKRAMYGIDPLQRLRLLRYQLDQQEDQPLPPDIEFHAELTRIFHSLRDLHTTYRLPYPFREVVAWLPFLVEEYWDEASHRRRYIVSKVVGEGELKQLQGAEILHWNGMPIETAVAINADHQAGSNPDARHARGLNSLTIRPLDRGLPPDEDWVTVRYQDRQGNIGELRQEWLAFIPPAGLAGLDAAGAATPQAASFGLDDHTDYIQEARKALYSPPQVLEHERASLPGVRISNGAGALPTSMPGVFRAREVETELGRLGHVRIFTFSVPEAGEFIAELGRLVEQLPQTGLILDVRGNGGGLITAAEGALQLFTSRRIEPQHAQFVNTPLNLALCEMNPDGQAGSVNLGRWAESIRGAVQTGAAYSLGFPITNPADLGAISRRYFGPVALITDALCYSATDIFAAGFQDHEIGPVIGIHGNTGAGGANVWSYGLLRQIWQNSAHLQATGRDRQAAGAQEVGQSPYVILPEGADFRVAVRRTIRVGLNAGGVIEDLGIRPDVQYHLTRRDLVEGNEDLIQAAAQALVRWGAGRARLRLEPGVGQLPRITVSLPPVGDAELTVSLHLRGLSGRAGEERSLDLAELLSAAADGRLDVEVRGTTKSGKTFTLRESLK